VDTKVGTFTFAIPKGRPQSTGRSMPSLLHVLRPGSVLTMLLMAACGGTDVMPMTPTSPTPSPTPVTASAYILPGAVSLGDLAFGDEPIVIYKSERLRWVNADTLTHLIVADSPDAIDFRETDALAGNGASQSFVMTRLGTTRIHCAIHPNMTGTLVVRERSGG
jgi:plastocyanin